MGPQPITQHRADRQVEAEEIASGKSAKVARPPRYRIILRIRHADLDPAEITTALGWEPQSSWKAGDQAVTPKGTTLPGVRSDGLWSRSFEFKGRGNIAQNLDELVDHLIDSKELFDRLHQMQAQSALYLQMPGNTNNGDRIPCGLLRKLADLQVGLEFEIFPNWP
jgi:hypothetical protein